jgi:hypothetical protein
MAGPPGEEERMCYNCGCRMSTEAHGDPNNITDKDFEQAAKAAGESTEEAMRHTLDLLRDKLGER